MRLPRRFHGSSPPRVIDTNPTFRLMSLTDDRSRLSFPAERIAFTFYFHQLYFHHPDYRLIVLIRFCYLFLDKNITIKMLLCTR